MTYDLLTPAGLVGALAPDILLIGGGLLVMLLAAWRPDSLHHQRTVGIATLGLLAATLASVVLMALRGTSSGAGVIAVDGFRWAADAVILLGAMATVALAIEHNERQGIPHGEMHVLVAFAASGMMVLTAGRDLIVLFIGLEILSVSAYALAGMNRRSPAAAEAALKYFLLGAFATGFLLYGMALIYGATGATGIAEINLRIQQYQLFDNPMLLIGVGLLTIGLAFKVAAAPFHMWAPDVYDGAPTPITAFFAAAVKASVIAAVARVYYESLQTVAYAWAPALWWIAVISIVVGNVVALRQQQIKRLLAYSSIVHTGYLLVLVLAKTPAGSAALVFYVFAYTLATVGALAVVSVLQGESLRPVAVDDFRGLWHARPALAAGMSVFLLALLGFPVFGGLGFFAKWYLVKAALSSPVGLTTLAVIVVATSVVSAGYYLRVVRVMFMEKRESAEPLPTSGAFTKGVLVVAAGLLLALGLYPTPLVGWAERNALAEVRTVLDLTPLSVTRQ